MALGSFQAKSFTGVIRAPLHLRLMFFLGVGDGVLVVVVIQRCLIFDVHCWAESGLSLRVQSLTSIQEKADLQHNIHACAAAKVGREAK